MNLASTLPTLLGIAWLLPLASFVMILFFGKYMGHHGKGAAYLAAGAIITAFVLSAISLAGWISQHPLTSAHHGETEVAAAAEGHSAKTAETGAKETNPKEAPAEVPATPTSYSGNWYSLAQIGKLQINIGWYIDALTVAMFTMVTLIASCIHVYTIGYMHEELHDVTDHEVTLSDGHHLHRPGRFHRFFQYLSLFCFSMLGLV
ncbi:MAG TPA: NADH-quinone oxidoreductase subunit L, partial [Pirellulales bacterium]